MATKSPSLSLPLSADLSAALDDELAKVRNEVINRSSAIAHDRATLSMVPSMGQSPIGAVAISLQDVSAALDEATGRTIQVDPNFFDYFPPFTCLCFVLCLLFGCLGLYALRGQTTTGPESRLAQSASGYLDVAKIFAGAIVGSTTSTVLKAKGKRNAAKQSEQAT